MSTDAYDLSERLYQAADAIRDGGQVPPDVAALLARMQGGGGQLNPDGSPAAASFVAPEALPPAEPAQPRSFAELDRALPGVVKQLDAAFAQPSSLENHARQEEARDQLDSFVAEFNASLDRAAAEQLGDTPTPPADLGELLKQARGLYGDPRGMTEDDALTLASQVNQALDQHTAAALREQDALMASLAAKAQQKRQAAAGAGR